MKRASFADNATGSGRTCEDPECLREAAARSRFCHACEKRRARGTNTAAPVREYGETPLSNLHRWALKYADADPDDDEVYRRADQMLKYSALRYAESMGYTKPKAASKLSG